MRTLEAGAALAVLALCALVASGCLGADEEGSNASTAFDEALGGVQGGEPLGAGIGWVDVDAVRAEPGSDVQALRELAPALGPGADDFLDESRTGLARLGLDPLAASEVISISGSYAFGVRLDGVDTARFSRNLGMGEPSSVGGDWTFHDLAEFGTAPPGRVGELTGALGSHLALTEAEAVFARADQARLDLVDVTEPASESALLSFVAECLGQVSAARVVPNNFNYLPKLGPRYAAFGVRGANGDPRREVLCGVEPSAVPVDGYAAALRETLAPGALEATTGEELGDLVSDVEVDTLDADGFHAARAEITLQPGERPGLVFRSFNRGSLVTFFGFQAPGTGTEPEAP